ncbi:methionine adenosyltransferase [Thioalkalivibrio paradoxus]|uniref:S-adenosylmethionine synthase n=1 Tax=Thioalkalivibrio paradoxus ARh 1 TaxID=713585 RepID=W0DHJ7_9GAMM|nr:methionine adenosyltransferase [Thioalkalivibrio paradoxus]AHE98104.1 S-adenosylmethionine synthetase [Thioalkalivibrio paradoxus ARh 1]
MTRSWLFTSESVSDGHPDKLADRISDHVLDRCLELEPRARVACETLLTAGFVVLAGEFRLAREADLERLQGELEALARDVLRSTGYHAGFPGIDPDRCEVLVRIHGQSVQIAKGVDREGGALGAGDQGLMFGHACDETPECMPLPIQLAHRLMRRQRELRRLPEFAWLRPDAKSQVSVRYMDGRPAQVETVVLSTQLQGEISDAEVESEIVRHLIEPVIPESLRAPQMRCLVNPAGRFEIGGPQGDTGLTGRKIIVDTYGASCPHGGGAFSGKDASKVDRSAAYAARWVAKNLVAAGAATRCTVQLAYAIGRPDPVSIRVDAHGTQQVDEDRLEQAVREVFDLTPAAIIRDLDLLRPIYAATAAYGHFGREEPGFSWEQTNRVDDLRTALRL